jgi:hypothetical protein
MNEIKLIDWPAIEIDYKAGVLSLRYLTAKYGCSLGAITRRAKRDGWRRVLVEQVGTQVTRENSQREHLAEENSQAVCSLTADPEREQPPHLDTSPPELAYAQAQQRYGSHIAGCRLAAGAGRCSQCLELSTQRDIARQTLDSAQLQRRFRLPLRD